MEILRYYRSYRKPGGSGLPLRHVFTTSREGVFVVLKEVTDGVATVKIWKGASIAKTASYWSTNEDFAVPISEVRQLEYKTREILNLLN